MRDHRGDPISRLRRFDRVRWIISSVRPDGDLPWNVKLWWDFGKLTPHRRRADEVKHYFDGLRRCR